MRADLDAAIVAGWMDAPERRQLLLRAADTQIARAIAAYRILGGMVGRTGTRTDPRHAGTAGDVRIADQVNAQPPAAGV